MRDALAGLAIALLAISLSHTWDRPSYKSLDFWGILISLIILWGVK
jgi:hypothetical protein